MARQKALFPYEATPEFLTFWDRYDYKTAKADAIKAWHQMKLSPADIEAIHAALAWQLPMWQRQGYGRPYAATYLRGKRWEDERPRSASRPTAGPFSRYQGAAPVDHQRRTLRHEQL